MTTGPVIKGPSALSLPDSLDRQGDGGAARSAATTPGRRMPVIDRNQVDPQIRAAGEGMEALFLDYMMKVMRETVPKNDMDLESPATEIYRGMLDSETSQRAAHAGGVGLADQIIAYLESRQYTLPEGLKGPGVNRAASTVASPKVVAPEVVDKDKAGKGSSVISSEGLVQGGTHEGH